LRYHRNNDVNIELDPLRRKRSQPIKLAVRKSVLNDEVSSLDIDKLAQPSLDFVVVGQWSGGEAEPGDRYPILGTFAACCARRKRPRGGDAASPFALA